ncbi:MAG: protease modulator HflK [Victivallaceae bacterium]|nr:protease modulator HflK [Victivallaceae bacterium]
MNSEKDLRMRCEKSRQLMVLSIVGGVVSLVLTVGVIIFGVAAWPWSKYGSWAGNDVFALMIVPFMIATLYSIAAAINGFISSAAYQEEEEKILLAKRKEKISAFEVNEDVRFTAGRSLKNYQKYAPYVIAALAVIIIAVSMFLFSSSKSARLEGTQPVPVDALGSAVAAIVAMVFSIFPGVFLLGQSKDSIFRWLRPVGAWLTAGAAVALIAAIGAIAYYRYNITGFNSSAAKVIFYSFCVLGIELIFIFVSEFYRPRSLEAQRPVFESRILALFTEPGGVARNIAGTLDYQFGFKVSGTWIYGFAEKFLFPLIILWLVILWSFTCISEVGPNQLGIRMQFGRITDIAPLDPGVYLKLPYPFGKIVTYSCEQISTIQVGPKMIDADGKETRPALVVWDKKHYAEESRYLVASETEDKTSAPVSLLGISIPIQYRIKKAELIDYAFRNQNSDAALKNIAEQISSRFFASVSIFDIMSSGREKASGILHKNIQAEADKAKLGIEIVKVNIHDAHPPEKIAPEFQKVIGASEEMESTILEARAYYNDIVPMIEAQKDRLIADAHSYAFQVNHVSQAESERFLRQLVAFKIMPQFFKLRNYLDMLEQSAGNARKYIMSASLEYEIYELNLEKKGQLDLIDANLSEISQK